MRAHSIEKGLALPEPKPNFGRDNITAILHLLDEYRVISPHSATDHVVCFATAALNSYCRYHRQLGKPTVELEDYLKRAGLVDSTGVPHDSAVLEVSREDIQHAVNLDFQGFVDHRHSIRQFSGEPVTLDSIRRAVHIAQKTPSVCNRQSSRVYVFDNDELGARVLACQNGNRGFGHMADKIAVVTSNLQCFLSPGERNQCWIDGGLFAMSLVYSLHSLGLGTCFLNWCVEPESDRQLREVAQIPSTDNIITLIAIGKLPERLRVARSRRKPLSEVLFYTGRSPTATQKPAEAPPVTPSTFVPCVPTHCGD